MRARSLKPGFFKNELLGSADPLISILFEGLWCSADREGRLEERPLRFCAEIFPYRRNVKEKHIEKWLSWLDSQKFIIRYEVGGNKFIQIVEFLKHQNPHTKERPSQIQAPTGFKHSARPVHDTDPAPDEDEPKPERALLTPDSGLLTPLSESKNPPNPPRGAHGASAPRERKPRDRSDASLRAWSDTTLAIGLIQRDHSKTWADADAAIDDPIAVQAIKAVGGHKLIADRTEFTAADFKRRFREAYEAELEKRQQAETHNGHDAQPADPASKDPEALRQLHATLAHATKGLQ
jgi:hypothetical protein